MKNIFLVCIEFSITLFSGCANLEELKGNVSNKRLQSDDDQARLIVAQFLGHDRTEISANYIGT